MLRTLDGLVLLKEIDEIDGLSYGSKFIQERYQEKIVVIRHTSYVYREVLCDIARSKATNLDNYIPVGELAAAMSIDKHILKNRINFMQKCNSRFFDFINLNGNYFIKIDDELKSLFQNYQPFLAGLSDAEHIVHCALLGDIKIGFY